MPGHPARGELVEPRAKPLVLRQAQGRARVPPDAPRSGLGTSLVRAKCLDIPLVVSLSNHEPNRSSFDRLRDERVYRRTHHARDWELVWCVRNAWTSRSW